MDLPPKVTKMIQLQKLPAFVIPDSEKSPVTCVLGYLRKLLAKELEQSGESLELPSIANLSQYFRCSPLEVYDALRELRQGQHEYQFSKFDHPIVIWQKADHSKRRNV
jgi:hypothetical protein